MKELIEFEMSDDFEHLPNSKAIKTYIRCFGEMSGSLETNSNKLLLGKFSAYFAELSREEQAIYLGMAKGCVKAARPVRDLLEFSYNLTVCFKKNDNEVNQEIEVGGSYINFLFFYLFDLQHFFIFY